MGFQVTRITVIQHLGASVSNDGWMADGQVMEMLPK